MPLQGTLPRGAGGTAKIPALFKTIQSRVGVPVEIQNPFKNIEIDQRRRRLERVATVTAVGERPPGLTGHRIDGVHRVVGVHDDEAVGDGR